MVTRISWSSVQLSDLGHPRAEMPCMPICFSAIYPDRYMFYLFRISSEIHSHRQCCCKVFRILVEEHKSSLAAHGESRNVDACGVTLVIFYKVIHHRFQ